MNRRPRLFLVMPLVFSLSIGMMYCTPETPDAPEPPIEEEEALTCNLTYNLPADVSTQTQTAFDEYSWQSFIALNSPAVNGSISTTGDNTTQWDSWSSTADLLDQGSNPGPSGSRYYPPACTTVANYQNYRVLDQVGKVDDSFLEAETQGLSANPVVASNGTFVRYEILLSPATYNWIVSEQLNLVTTLVSWATANPKKDVNFQCGMPSYTGGDPADSLMGAIVLKNAWMDMTGFDASQYHTEDLLVYTPAYRNSTGVASCEVKTMGLVGMHIAHKTLSQPNWTWSTFEHANNAPDCTALPDDGNEEGDDGPSSACPTSVSRDWNFFGQACNSGDACQTCNASPATNAAATECVNPSSGVGGWCLDQPPNATQGTSRLCRQFPVAANYPTAANWNAACDAALTGGVWSNYQLISTQWVDQPAHTSCLVVQDTLQTTSPSPKTTVTGADGAQRPFLGNTSMESYERSNCTACHMKGKDTKFVVDGDTLTITNDFMYWLVLEVPAADNQ